MKKPQPLGRVQIDVLRVMAEHGGTWHRWSGWSWDGEAGTRRIMQSLERRGSVTTEMFKTGMGTVQGYRAVLTKRDLENLRKP